VLSTVALNGGVAVQVGAVSNPAGSGAVDATGWTPSPAAPAAAGSPEGAGAGPARVVVSPPALVADAKGQYPSEHRDLGRVVRVDLMIRIDPRGEVRGASVTRGDRPAFDDEARRTVARLRFRPATRDGSPIPWEMKWTVVFLPEGAS
jgi:protein TonB